MHTFTVYKVGLIGGGVMGRGIAMLIAEKAEIPVVIKEANRVLADNVSEAILKTLTKRFDRGQLTGEQRDRIRAMVSVTDDVHEMHDADLVIEAVPENLELKKRVFQELDEIVQPWAIFASNTSSLSISEMAAITKRKDRVVGLHFFNPPHRMRLVELVATEQTQQNILDGLKGFAEELGKVVVRVKECPGFLVNRMLMPYLNEAAKLLTETTLTMEEIDAETAQNGWPMGPFLLLDMVGVDVSAEVARVLYQAYGERAKPAPIMDVLVGLKRFGQKSGANGGFYGGEIPVAKLVEERFPASERKSMPASEGYRRMMTGLAKEALMCLEEQVASLEDIEKAALWGIGFPAHLGGPIAWARKEGI